MARDYYQVLGVSRTASADEIRKAHRALARKLHPDLNKAPDAQAKFAEIQHAYDILSDPEKRKLYDQFGEAGISGAGAGAAGGQSGGWGGRAGSAAPGPGGFGNLDEEQLRDIFEEHFGGGGFGGFGGFGSSGNAGGRRSGGRGGRARKSRGEDVEAEVHVAFETAALGGNAAIRLQGVDASGDKTITVKIPAGVGEGSVVRLRGQGHAGEGGGEAGDLLMTIHVAPHPWFTRDGLDLSVHIPVSIVECALGASVDVPLLRGHAAVQVPAGTSSGKRIRLAGQGVTNAKGEKGSLFAVIDVVAPTGLTNEDRASLEHMRASVGDPRKNVPWRSAPTS